MMFVKTMFDKTTSAKWIAFLLSIAPLPAVSIMDPRLPGIEIEFKASLEPAGSGPAALPGVVVVGPNRVYRVIQDAAHQIYLGYDVIVEPSPDGKNFQVRTAPLSASPDRLRQMGLGSTWTKRSLYGDFSIPEIRVGTSMKLRLAVNQSSGQEIVDVITIRKQSDPKSPARDFTVADAELHFSRLQFRVNGELEPMGSIGTSGAAVWFYAFGHGRFVFTLAPHPELGFTKMGVITGTRLTIALADSAGGSAAQAEVQTAKNELSQLLKLYTSRHPKVVAAEEQLKEAERALRKALSTVFQLDSADEIASTTGSFNVYGRQDKDWTPSQGGRFVLGSADRPEWIR
jgi:acyl-coenzyme A thioesterase PaaI-like protein